MNNLILLIDGDTNRKNNFASRLRVQGYDVELANGGFHSVHLVEKQEYFSVIIMGNTHDMPGLEILSLIRNVKTKDQLPIIFVNKTTNQEDVLACFEFGANDFIVYSPQCFNSIIEKLKKFKKK
ncbi:PleD family two-component system response regulator [Halobacteriovorax sp. HLS]|uniref:response regulator n=1 Tax=Halobacteriovorax sp. HLS TaxID=2234000 RepID=UPI000FD6BF62|nr:response regulator [Halobacteriovorax sp. HLS]